MVRVTPLPTSHDGVISAGITETEFNELLLSLPRTGPETRVEFWNHVAKIAGHDNAMREYLEKAIESRDLGKSMKSDMESSLAEVKCAVVLAAGYCVARPQLARHLDTKTLVQTIVSIPRNSQYSKQLCIKCAWAIANVRQAGTLSDLGYDVMEMLCDILNQKVLKDDVAVHKELVRLLDKMLLSVPGVACQTTFLQAWLPRVISLTVNKLQVIREKAKDILNKHMGVLLREAGSDVNKISGQILFMHINSRNKPSNPLLQELQDLAANGHSGYVIDVWLSLVHMTSKLIMKRSAYSNELFSIPNYFTKHLSDDESRLSLLQSWIKVVDIYRDDNPDFFSTSKQMKFFMTPFFTIKTASLTVNLALVKSWWYLVVACHNMNYINTFTAVLEPCVKMCFKAPELGDMVQQGGYMLCLLLDTTPPGCDLVPITPCSLDLSANNHAATFFKYLDTLIRYKPSSLVIEIWSRLCDCVKGKPDPSRMIAILDTAMDNISPINVMSMVESLSLSGIVTSLHKALLAEYLIRCAKKGKDLPVHNKLHNLFKSVEFSDPSYLKLINRVLSYISSDEVDDMEASCLCLVWQTASKSLCEYTEHTGGQINEGTRIDPQFTTIDTAVSYVFRLFQRTKSIEQSMTQSLCQVWERLVSLFVEHTAQYSSVNIPGVMVRHILESCIDTTNLYPLIYCSKVLVEECPVPQISLLQSSSSPTIFQLVSSVLERVHTESKQSGLAPPTLSLCIEMCTASWSLLTPGQIVPVLKAMRVHYLGLLAPDMNYPPAVQNTVKTSYTSLLACVQKHMTFYTSTELQCLEDYLVYGLKHHKKLVRLAAAKFWNSSFGIAYNGSFSPRLRAVIESEAKRSALIVPGNSSTFTLPRAECSQTTELSGCGVKSNMVEVKGSFLARKSEVSPNKVKQTALSSKNNGKVLKRLVSDESQDCIPISTSPKKQKILTKHQKEKILKQRLDRDVPVMYNSLDANSQEPILFDVDSQSQTPLTPENRTPPPPPTVPAAKSSTFKSRSLLFLSPSVKKSSQSVVAKTIAMLPTCSPDLRIGDSANDTQVNDSEDDVYCGTLEDISDDVNTEHVITPPSTDIPAMMPLDLSNVSELKPSISGIMPPTNDSTMQPPSIVLTDENGRSKNDSNLSKSTRAAPPVTPVSPVNARKNFTAALKSMMDGVTLRTPTSLTLAPPSSESECRSTSSDTTPSESCHSSTVNTRSGPTPTPVNIASVIVADSPLFPKECIVDQTPDAVPETPVSPNPVVLVEDTQDNSNPEGNMVDTITVPESLPPQSLPEREVDLQTFSNEISFVNCSTAIRQEDSPERKTRRSSRLMPKKMKSEDLGIRKSGQRFKRIKSSEDWCSPDVQISDKVMSPIREEVNLSPLRKSVRPRKSSVKLRDDSFITHNIPSSITSNSSNSQQGSDCPKSSSQTAIADKKSQDNLSTRKSLRIRSKSTPGAVLEQQAVPDSIPQDEDSAYSREEIVDRELVGCQDLPRDKNTDVALKSATDQLKDNSISVELSSGLGGIVKDSLKYTKLEIVGLSQDCVSIPDSQPLASLISTSPTSPNMQRSKRSSRKTECHIVDERVSQKGSSRKNTIDSDELSLPPAFSATSVSIVVEDSVQFIEEVTEKAPKDSVHQIQEIHVRHSLTPEMSTEKKEEYANKIISNDSGEREIQQIGYDTETEGVGLGLIAKDSLVLIKNNDSTSNSGPPKGVDEISIPDSQPILTEKLIASSPARSVRKSRRINRKVGDSPQEQTDQESCGSNNVSNLGNKSVPSSHESKSLITDYLSACKPKQLKVELSSSAHDSFSTEDSQLTYESHMVAVEEHSAETQPKRKVGRPRKQSRPMKKVVLPPSERRKSSRLKIRSQNDESQASECLELGDEETTSVLPQSVNDLPLLDTSSETLTQCSVVECENREKNDLFLSQTNDSPLRQEENVMEDIPSSQVLSLEVTFSQKEEVLSPRKRDVSEPKGSLSGPLSSVESIETFGKVAVKEELQLEYELTQESLETVDDHGAHLLPCTPQLGLDTLEDPSAKDDREEFDIEPKIRNESSVCDELLAAIENEMSDDEDVKNKTDTDTDAQEDLEEPLAIAKRYREFDEFEESDISEIFCASSQENELQSPPREKCAVDIMPETSHVICDSQILEEPDLSPSGLTSRSLRREPSIPSNLPQVMKDMVDVEVAQMGLIAELEVKTPPKTIKQDGAPLTPSTPKTPSSILKKAREPGSASPSSSKRRVTFGPLPEPHRDPNEVTPRRHQRTRKSPARLPIQPTPAPIEEAIYPGLVHCTVQAHSIIRNLCSGFTLSQRTFNLSIVSSSIKTIGDLARLTAAQIEEFPFITPKVIQVRRQLKKYEASLSPTLSAKSFLLGTKAREQLKPGSDSLETVAEAGMEKENDVTTATEEVDEHPQGVVAGGPISVSVAEATAGDKLTGAEDLAKAVDTEDERCSSNLDDVLPVENDNKENIDPNQKDDSSGKDPAKGELSVEADAVQVEPTSEKLEEGESLETPLHFTEQVIDDERTTTMHEVVDLENTPSDTVEDPPLADLHNAKSACQTLNEAVIVVGCPAQNAVLQTCETTDESERIYSNISTVEPCTSLTKMVEESHRETSEDDEVNVADVSNVTDVPEGEPGFTSDDDHDEVMQEVINSNQVEVDMKMNANADTKEIDGIMENCDSHKSVEESALISPGSDLIHHDKCGDKGKAEPSDSVEQSPIRTEVKSTVICEDSPMDLQCHEKLSAEVEQLETDVTIVLESSVESMSQCISKNLVDLARDSVSPLSSSVRDNLVDDTTQPLPEESVPQTGSDTAERATGPQITASEEAMLESDSNSDLMGTCQETLENHDKDLSAEKTEGTEDVLMNGLVDYPITQPNLVDYPLTQPASEVEEKVSALVDTLRAISDSSLRNVEILRVVDILCQLRSPR